MTDYNDPTSVNQEAIAEAKERLARQKARGPYGIKAVPEPVAVEKKLSARAAAIQMAAKKANPSDRVRLDVLSANTPNGEVIEVTCRRLTIQQVAAAELLPTNAGRIVDRLIRRG